MLAAGGLSAISELLMESQLVDINEYDFTEQTKYAKIKLTFIRMISHSGGEFPGGEDFVNLRERVKVPNPETTIMRD